MRFMTNLFIRLKKSFQLCPPANHTRLNVDLRKPYKRNEVYVIVSGSGVFRSGERRKLFQPGEVLFAPAGVENHFEEFTDNFAAYVFFYGPKGIEVRD